MERGTKTLIILLAGAIVFGALVVAVNPDYRGTFKAWIGGSPESAPIWRSNEAYYDAVDLESSPAAAQPAGTVPGGEG